MIVENRPKEVTAIVANWWTLVIGSALLLGGCSTVPVVPEPAFDIASIPDAVPRMEVFGRSGNPESYEQNGQRYWILSSPWGYTAKGIASWYGKKFHGRRASSGETYNMYAMTAAHKTLPIPCYARVTNLDNGRSVVVKINDRGPFIDGRIIDMSYVAAHKLGMVEKGTANVEVRVIDTRNGYQAPAEPPVAVAKPVAPAATGSVYGEVVPRQAKPVAVTSVPATVVAPTEPELVQASVPIVTSQATSGSIVESPASLSAGTYLQLGAYSSAANAGSAQRKLSGLQSTPVEVEEVKDVLGTLYRVLVGPLPSETVAKELAGRLKRLGWDQHRVVSR